MAYLFFEILGSLVIVALISFFLGWYLRGIRDQLKRRGSRME